MDSSCSVNRRQAWAQSSRHWLTVEDPEVYTSPSNNTPTASAAADAQLSLQDRLFPDGCSTGKIETWLQSCGNSANQEISRQITLESWLKSANSFEDDLSLGAEATGLDGGLHVEELGHCPLLMPPPKSRRRDLQTSTPQQTLNLPLKNMGQSMASSIFSSVTTKTASSLSDVLQMCAEDAEETLYHLGFGCEEPQVTARIPARFFTFPSQLRGINFRLFLESQLRRIREEDPSLSLASRFRQVEVLTAMANAFYSLYSHVSRTPLQKLAPPEFSFSSPTVERTIGQRFFGNVRTEPRSPVERLKDTVSKMCLYTRGSDSTSPNWSPRKRNSLPDVVEVIVGGVRGAGSPDQVRGMWIQGQTSDCITCKAKDGKERHHAEVTSDHENTSSEHKQRIKRWSQSGQREGARAKGCLFHSDRASVDSRHSQISQDFTFSDASKSSLVPDPTNDPNEPAPIITYDAVSPQIVEFVHKRPYGRSEIPLSHSGDTHKPDSEKVGNEPSIMDTKSSASQSNDALIVQEPVTSTISQGDPGSLQSAITHESPCQIMVTGWEEDEQILHTDSHEDRTHFKYPVSTAQTQASEQQRYLSPNCQIKPANSFELEEVQSVGEEENSSVEQCSSYTLSVTGSMHQKFSALRGDSFQSDSSGYAEEDIQNLHISATRD